MFHGGDGWAASSVLADRSSLMGTKDQHPEGDGLAQAWQGTSVTEGGHLYKPLGQGSGKKQEQGGPGGQQLMSPTSRCMGQLAVSGEQWRALCP